MAGLQIKISIRSCVDDMTQQDKTPSTGNPESQMADDSHVGSAESQVDRGFERLKDGSCDKAIGHFDEAIKLDPKSLLISR